MTEGCHCPSARVSLLYLLGLSGVTFPPRDRELTSHLRYTHTLCLPLNFWIFIVLAGGISSPSRTFCSLEASGSPSVLWGADSFFPDSCSYAACCSPLVCLAKGQEDAFEVLQPLLGFLQLSLFAILARESCPAFVQSSPHYFSSCISSGTRLTHDRQLNPGDLQ